MGGVLIVDPDPADRAGLAAGLREKGWRVWAVGTRDEACTAVRALGPAVGVAVVDLRLPGLEGARVMADLVGLQPDLRPCVMSAGIDPGAAAAFRRLSDTPLLTKPLRIDHVDDVLRSLVVSARAG
jgi:CheY-like chemotaxis protein